MFIAINQNGLEQLFFGISLLAKRQTREEVEDAVAQWRWRNHRWATIKQRIWYSSRIVHVVLGSSVAAFMLAQNWKWNFYDSSYLMISFITSRGASAELRMEPMRGRGSARVEKLLTSFLCFCEFIMLIFESFSIKFQFHPPHRPRPSPKLENFMFMMPNKLWHVLPRWGIFLLLQ